MYQMQLQWVIMVWNINRDIIADSIEMQCQASTHYDGIICIAGCDKNMPDSIMALRLNRPGFMIYGGSIKPGLLSKKQHCSCYYQENTIDENSGHYEIDIVATTFLFIYAICWW